MMRLPGLASLALGCLAAAPAAQTGAAPADAPASGIAVTFERGGSGDAGREVHTERGRLFALAVERGETPTPFLAPGLFRATYRGIVALPLRDRYHFRVEGRGSVELACNGEVVLSGAPRPGKPLQTVQPVRLKKGDNELRLSFESAAFGDGQFRLSWSGPDFAFEPIAPERLRPAGDLDAVAAGELRRRGMTLFGQHHCARCHDPMPRRIGESAFGELDGTGPDLRGAGARLRQDWVAAWLLEPRRFHPAASMPAMAFGKPQEAHDVAAWLVGATAAPASPTWPEGAAARGADLFARLGCVACHPAVDAAAPADDRLPLAFVPQKWHAEALVEYLENPRARHPHTRMPDFRLGRDEAIALAAHLLAKPPEPLPQSRGDATAGRVVAQRHGCALCHGLDLQVDERRWPMLQDCKPERGCLAENAADRRSAPDHGFTAAERAALRAFLPFAADAPYRRAPVDFAARHLRAQRCTSCHGFDGAPSRWAVLAEQGSTAAPWPHEHDPRAQGVPALTWVGAKLQPSWIENFVLGREASPRPWLAARMPAFHRHGAAITGGLVREHGYGPQDEPAVAADAQAAIHGERLVQMGTGFGCVQCHALAGKPAVQVFERAGIDLATARGRLRHEYYSRWLLDPPRIDPDARMPRYADPKGRTAITDVLGGDAVQQFEAIWQFLGTQERPR